VACLGGCRSGRLLLPHGLHHSGSLAGQESDTVHSPVAAHPRGLRGTSNTMSGGIQPYNPFRFLSALIWLGLAVIGGFVYCVYWIWSGLILESRYREKYGAVWKAKFEHDHYSLSHVHSQMIVCAVCLLALAAVLVWVYRMVLRENHPDHSASTVKSHPHRYSSHLERVIHHRRNALLWIAFGLGGVVAGILLVVFPSGIFTDRRNEMALAILVFCCGYGGVIVGCWWWLKAKHWYEDLVFMGLLPLGLLFARFVRLFLLTNPQVLISGMILMPFILIVVVMMSPDKSEAAQKRPLWDRD
jgi:hypothetical protein